VKITHKDDDALSIGYKSANTDTLWKTSDIDPAVLYGKPADLNMVLHRPYSIHAAYIDTDGVVFPAISFFPGLSRRLGRRPSDELRATSKITADEAAHMMEEKRKNARAKPKVSGLRFTSAAAGFAKPPSLVQAKLPSLVAGPVGGFVAKARALGAISASASVETGQPAFAVPLAPKHRIDIVDEPEVPAAPED
jgi:hypothetical protein